MKKLAALSVAVLGAVALSSCGTSLGTPATREEIVAIAEEIPANPLSNYKSVTITGFQNYDYEVVGVGKDNERIDINESYTIVDGQFYADASNETNEGGLHLLNYTLSYLLSTQGEDAKWFVTEDNLPALLIESEQSVNEGGISGKVSIHAECFWNADGLLTSMKDKEYVEANQNGMTVKQNTTMEFTLNWVK